MKWLSVKCALRCWVFRKRGKKTKRSTKKYTYTLFGESKSKSLKWKEQIVNCSISFNSFWEACLNSLLITIAKFRLKFVKRGGVGRKAGTLRTYNWAYYQLPENKLDILYFEYLQSIKLNMIMILNVIHIVV